MAVGESRQEGVTELDPALMRLADNTSLTPQLVVALSFTAASTSDTTPVGRTARLSSEFSLGGSRAVSTSGESMVSGRSSFAECGSPHPLIEHPADMT